jgi:hypothetical protein
MSAISVRMPDWLHRAVKATARRAEVSINQMVNLALAEKLSALETEDYLLARGKRGSHSRVLKALRKVRNAPPEPRDRL